MDDQVGLSFLPNPTANGPRPGENGGARLEDILRVLSFRLPKVLGAHAIAPAELLNSPGGAALPSGGGTGGDPLADIITRTIIGRMPQMPTGAPQGMPLPGMPPHGGGGGAANPAGSFEPNIGSGAPHKPRTIPIENPPYPGGTAGPNPPFPGNEPGPGDNSDVDPIRRQILGGRRPRV